VKQERFDWPADNPFYTKRFTFHIRRRCRNSSIQDVAKERLLDWKTVKALEMEYMREQIKRAGHPRPEVLGVDEISIRKGHTYRIVVSDLERRRAIWFGGKDRSEESMDEFFAFLGDGRTKRVRSWICGSHSGIRRIRGLPRQPFSSISSTS
jgi:transposase